MTTTTTDKATESVKFSDGLFTFVRSTGSAKAGNYKVEARYSIRTGTKNLSELLGKAVEVTKDATLPAPMRVALVKHLTTTSLPVFLRARIPNGGEFASLRAAFAACSGEQPVSALCGQVKGLIQAFGGDTPEALVAARDAALSALGVTLEQWNEVVKGKDPWEDQE